MSYHALLARLVQRRVSGPWSRPSRVIHSLDGIAERPTFAALSDNADRLWRQWTQHPRYTEATLLVGLDAGGIVPLLGLAGVTCLPYKIAWKLDLALPDQLHFIEHGAERRDVFLYGRFAGDTVIIVDDEITTGLTAGCLARILTAQGASVAAVLVFVQVGDAAYSELAGVPLLSLKTIES